MFVEYVKENRKALLLVAKEAKIPQEVPIALVSGYAKTAAWAMGAYQLDQNAQKATFAAGFDPVRAGCGWNIQASSGLLVQEAYGPMDETSWNLARGDSPDFNMCIMLYFYKIASRPWWKFWLKASAGPAPLPDPDRGTEQPPAVSVEVL